MNTPETLSTMNNQTNTDTDTATTFDFREVNQMEIKKIEVHVSPVNFHKYNVVAINDDYEVLYTIDSDLDAWEALGVLEDAEESLVFLQNDYVGKTILGFGQKE